MLKGSYIDNDLCTYRAVNNSFLLHFLVLKLNSLKLKFLRVLNQLQ